VQPKHKPRLATVEDGRTGQLKLKLIQDGTAYDIKVFSRDQVRTPAQAFSWVADVFTELRKHGIPPHQADELFKELTIPGLSLSPQETVLTTGTVSSQGQIKIKEAVKPFLPWQPGDQIEFVLKEKDVVIRNTRKKA
jgi:hypothetical protein